MGILGEISHNEILKSQANFYYKHLHRNNTVIHCFVRIELSLNNLSGQMCEKH